MDFLGLTAGFGAPLLLFGFILLLAPYFSGADFGAFKIPLFTERARRLLKIIGPVVFILFILMFIPLIPPKEQPPPKQQSIEAQAKSAGLTGLENREDPTTSAPPEKVFDLPEKEIVITGLSCYRTFDIHLDKVKQLLGRNIDVYIMIMDPDSEDMPKIATRQSGVNIRNDIIQTIHRIKEHKLAQSPRFHIRYFQRMPPFTGILIDGDILAHDRVADDIRGSIRIQPGTEFTPQGKGLIFCFEKTAGKKLGGFDLYTKDLRSQWHHAEWSDEKIQKAVR